MPDYHHIPVLLDEVLFYLEPKPGQNIVDATLGGGGYSLAIVRAIGEKGNMLAIDLDQQALQNQKAKNLKLSIKNLTLAHGNFSHISHIAKNHDFRPPDGIVADLGLSSYELDQGGRGMSFQKQEILDMRFDQTAEAEDARWILKNKSEAELTKIFTEYGEEKFSRQIARKIKLTNDIKYTTDLYQVIVDSLPKPVKHKAADSARRIFQALRIAVNHELENLEEFLPQAFNLLVPGGRLAVVSFHSLEDRQVKQFFNSLAQGCVCPRDFPQCVCGKNPKGKILTKKPVTASAEELNNNPRSKSAKLRVIQKI